MENTFDLYGIAAGDLETARKLVEEKLCIQFVSHDSSFLGSYYRMRKPNGEEFVLQRNFDEKENEWFEQQYKDMGIILYVNQPANAETIKAKLLEISEVTFLRRRERN